MIETIFKKIYLLLLIITYVLYKINYIGVWKILGKILVKNIMYLMKKKFGTMKKCIQNNYHIYIKKKPQKNNIKLYSRRIIPIGRIITTYIK
jgi:hypothetical protein